ncbi:hypothetical protein N9Z92_03915, partial [Akkermansiaceae bacterium]|nr:hypothetical protein [Akkermansiaceae bacterium]
MKTRNINSLHVWQNVRALTRELFTVILSLNLCSVTLAQENFGDPVVYPNLQATVYGVVTIDDQPAETGDVVGFFVGSELRFKGPVVVSDGKAYVLGLMNAAGGSEIFTFKVYDNSANAVYPVPDISLAAAPGAEIGPDPLFEIKASSGLGIEEQLVLMTAARDAAIEERDARPTQAALDMAVAEARAAGQSDVTTDPAKYDLVTQASYNAIVTERDARFVDTDGDGLTDVKEVELETDATIETRFYLQAAYDSAIIQYLSEGRKAGQSDVTENPANFDLTTVEAYNAVVAERDARPTQAAYEAVITERDTNLATYTTALAAKEEVIGDLNES